MKPGSKVSAAGPAHAPRHASWLRLHALAASTGAPDCSQRRQVLNKQRKVANTTVQSRVKGDGEAKSLQALFAGMPAHAMKGRKPRVLLKMRSALQPEHGAQRNKMQLANKRQTQSAPPCTLTDAPIVPSPAKPADETLCLRYRPTLARSSAPPHAPRWSCVLLLLPPLSHLVWPAAGSRRSCAARALACGAMLWVPVVLGRLWQQEKLGLQLREHTGHITGHWC
ncbi:hypothetical protein COO60DRAFT_1457653 [Scenedesmus sp. NREL 46B-D3]|nr:hypothetical protein COO60DRAFT_1457653 [Scenedesmus sp. NREL 46B-D3]